MTRIERFASRAHAELARTVLEAGGIPAYVSGDDAGGLHPEIPYGIGGTAVVVPDDRYLDAIALLEEEFGDDPVAVAELEAAAMAATMPTEGDAAAGPSRWDAEADGDGAAAPTTAGSSTRRSGSHRRVFLVVVVLMLAAVLVSALVLELSVVVDRFR